MNGSIMAKQIVPAGPINKILSGIHHHEVQDPEIIEMFTNWYIEIAPPKMLPIIARYIMGFLRNRFL